MSHELINRSEDLTRLKNDGYSVGLSGGYLIINHIPYVDENRLIKYGTIASKLELAGDTTVKPGDHVALWIGDHPCNYEGAQLTSLVNGTVQTQIQDGLTSSYSFSQRPSNGYDDYYHKMTTYIRILQSEACVLEPSVTALVGQSDLSIDEDSVFNYIDTASSRVGITTINNKLKADQIAIIGLGGTGAYILDLVAKTPVKGIHLFDDDKFLQHNAFRSPGAPSSDELSERTTKVEQLEKIYSRMHKKIIPHPQRINESNISELNSVTFVFLCVDNDKSRRPILNHLIKNEIPFIDVGIGLYDTNNALGGSVRITTSTPTFNNHAVARCIHSDDGDDGDDDYSSNIQISEMNALNAALAVIKWKKMREFYHDLNHEHHTVYGIITNVITNEEVANETKDNQS